MLILWKIRETYKRVKMSVSSRSVSLGKMEMVMYPCVRVEWGKEQLSK